MSLRVKEPTPDSVHKVLVEYPELLRTLLYHRGICDAESARIFLSPDYEKHIHDPFLMKGMEEAVERILRAIVAKEKMVIFCDYDADGVPGGVLFQDFFTKIGFTNFSIYIPHRHDEGFGLNEEAISEFARDGAKLVVTVDCGVADEKEIAHGKSLGMEIIVTDHHILPEGGVPSAYAVLDPKQDGCAYPFKELCGTGVAFKLIQALLIRLPRTLDASRFTFPARGWEKWLLDMVGIATLSDMVPLVGENRVFAHYGLIVLRKSPRPGIQKLFRKERINQRFVTEDDVVFSLTPKLNAASRLGSADVAFRLLATHDEAEADQAVDELLALNTERKGVVGSLVKEIKHVLSERETLPSVIVVGNPKWRPSLLGLVATSLVREYNRPVFLWGRDGAETLKGSCRSDGHVNVYALMCSAVKGTFLEFGGHAFSGGFCVSYEAVHTLEASLVTSLEKMKDVSSVEAVSADVQVSSEDITSETFRLMQKLAPFGQGNPKPTFLFTNVQVVEAKKFGKEKNHTEISFARKYKPLKAISFFSDTALPSVGAKVNLLASLEESRFGGRTELRLRIVAFS